MVEGDGLNSQQRGLLEGFEKHALENDLEIRTVVISMVHEETEEQIIRRNEEGLFYLSFHMLQGRRPRETCFYDGTPLVDNLGPNNMVGYTSRFNDSDGKSNWSRWVYCPTCDLLYDLPVSEKERKRLLAAEKRARRTFVRETIETTV